jgi:UDP-N-acetyl-D-glucosamine dehydrogenase
MMNTVGVITSSRVQEILTNPEIARVGVVGLGYVGLPLALLFSGKTSAVVGFDIDGSKVERLMAGATYILDIPAASVAAARERGFEATTKYSRLSELDAVIICVPTPLDQHHEPDLSYIENTARAIAPHLRAGQLVVLESTTYPGTTEEVLIPILETENTLGLRAATQETDNNTDVFYVAFSPEREDPGNKMDRRDIPKVVGGVSPQATELACALYGRIFNRIVPVSSSRAAEMTKLLENIYRCVNIALVNELKLLCLRMGINIWEVIEAARTKPFGFQPFYPGPGLGGHCIPIDPFYLSWKAREYDFHTRFIELAGEINLSMPYHVVAAVQNALSARKKCLNGAQVLVLGVAYKRDVDDLRESPALTLIELLRDTGASVAYNDPYLPYVGHGRHYSLNMASTPLEQLEQWDCVLIVTDHSAYDWARIVQEASLVVDTRNATADIVSPKIVRC